ncbi:hypothetical protein SAMN05660845_1158 [Flavobacterium swingsii]|jgi:hypothetical protein|uniref:DUF4397 domain-containing protein n=1 Tax=Flavobacterium swingsii TaxID=498292 RepID=A0A1I0XDL2_9FLAO|nr:hypothetical protein [Flavobacterium swingsii]SFA98516.1 hypothetical protein SAMN05660845_1158 [Flavobacterium swingsii]
MKKIYLLFLLITYANTFAQVSGVGVGTSNPQQTLHLAGATGTVRVDGLSSTNNAFNGGGFDKTFPLYVNNNGDLTLSLSTFTNSDGTDAFTGTTLLPAAAIVIPTTATAPNNGTRNVLILAYPITVTRNVVLEIKYNISFEVYRSTGVLLKNNRARRISTFYTVDAVLGAGVSKHGQASKCYFSNDTSVTVFAAPGNMYNSTSTYIPLTAGTHTIRFYGEANTGTTNDLTLVNFGIGNDSVFMRIY